MNDNYRAASEMLTKIIREGNYKEGVHKGYKYEIKRMEHSGHLCGYIYFDKNATAEQYEIMDYNFHGGVTWGFDGELQNGKYGFDCAHGGDYSPLDIFGRMRLFEYSTYKDMEYVEKNIIEVIDKLVEVQG